jgi:hypothetical protein
MLDPKVKASALDILDRDTKKQRASASAQDAAARRQREAADEFKKVFEDVVVSTLGDFATALTEGGRFAEARAEPPAKGQLRHTLVIRVEGGVRSCTYDLDANTGTVTTLWSTDLQTGKPHAPALVTELDRKRMESEVLAFLSAVTGVSPTGE